MCILCILIPIVLGLICALLAYLLGRYIEKKSKVYTELRANLDSCRKENGRLQSENQSLLSEMAGMSKKSSSEKHDFDAALAKSVFGKKIVQDDLKIIEGIGPKIEELLKNAGIKTWKALSEAPVDTCQKILDDAGSRYQMHDPKSWPIQSEMAYFGKWDELKKWQDEMTGGRV